MAGDPPGSPPKLDGPSRPAAAPATPPRELVDAILWAGREHDPASDQVPEDFARLGDLAPARAELPHKTGGVPGGAARQLAPLEEDHVPPPELRQVVGDNYTRRCPLPMMTTSACAGSEAGMAGR